jgi:hypothetical protein
VIGVGNKSSNFNHDDIVVDLETKENNISIDAMPPLFSHDYLSLESKLKQLETYKNVFMLWKKTHHP